MKNVLIILFVSLFFTSAYADKPKPNNTKSKFYDFSDQIIDGEIRRPTGTYANARERARFNRLLRLKRSFLPDLFSTSKDKVLK